MSDFECVDVRFRRIILPNAWVEKLYGECRWAEGPVYFADADQLIWSDIPNNRMLRWVPGMGVGVFRQPSNFSNGNTRDRQGRLVSCEHGGRRVTRTESDGRITVLAEQYRNKHLNSPNDVVVKSDGSIWFSDPTYGILSDYEGYRAEPEQDGNHLYRVDPERGTLEIMVDDFVQPNGLAFSLDERLLYVSDSGASHLEHGPRHVRVFEVDGDQRLRNARVFTQLDAGIPDGLKVDDQGNVWISAADGVHCYCAAGELLGKIRIPEPVANLSFGGPRRNRLFITATTSLYAVYVAVSGAQTR